MSVLHGSHGNTSHAVLAVDRASITVGAGEIVGVVGESGSGKTSLAMAVAGLGAQSGGQIFLAGELLEAHWTADQRAEVQVVLQDPHGSLDPRQTVRGGFMELRRTQPQRTKWISDEDLLAKVGLQPEVLDRLPHEMSGGQAQRISIARALLLRPRLLIADEPTSALDVSVQAQILSLLLDLRRTEGLCILFISHDLAVIRSICDRVYVMLHGRVVESGEVSDVFDHPANVYTKRLLQALPGRGYRVGDALVQPVTTSVSPAGRLGLEISLLKKLRQLLEFPIRTLVHGFVTLLIAVSIAFLLARMSGDPVREMLGDLATPEQITALSTRLGLDQSIGKQYVDFLGKLASGNLGESLRYESSNLGLILSRVPASIALALTALFLGILFGIPLGIVAALNEGRLVDRLASGLALLGESFPLFWLGLMLILVFAVTLGWLPAGQSGDVKSVILPAVTLSFLPMAQVARLTRSSMSEILGETFMTATWARGISSWRTVLIHGFRNASLPVLTIIGLQMGSLLSGAITVEFVFAWPGLGTLATQAVQNRDFSLIQALVVFGALVFVTINVIVDLLYGVLDPRIRVKSS
jgi:peptide/nickel transport system permease protein